MNRKKTEEPSLIKSLDEKHTKTLWVVGGVVAVLFIIIIVIIFHNFNRIKRLFKRHANSPTQTLLEDVGDTSVAESASEFYAKGDENERKNYASK